jgi:hypothetical protein
MQASAAVPILAAGGAVAATATPDYFAITQKMITAWRGKDLEGMLVTSTTTSSGTARGQPAHRRQGGDARVASSSRLR